ncbi:uncharacterized protein CEXT_64901 [Caerostris extrusa]|uniref:Uncharacterized protein n=1 Tax=Caerostris extrusa TaxID=172846 RepID=A0AAV4T1Q4_CAEEX|nr:uncharacterized protein CEXT_64901 [Caerostris extrusa]
MVLLVYQLAVIFCYTELLPIPQWMDKSSSPQLCEIGNESRQEDSRCSEHQNKSYAQKSITDLQDKLKTGNSCTESRTYKLRNWKKGILNGNQSTRNPPEVFDASHIKPMEEIGDYNFAKIKDSETTKRYYFPYREKRLEEWINKEEDRPHKIRPQEFKFPENSRLHLPDSSDVTSSQNCDETMQPENSKDQTLPKSYSFPFRRKPLQTWMETPENRIENPEITSSMPHWRTIDGSMVEPKCKIRRSLSGSELIAEDPDSNTKYDKHKSFSQSVEISNVSNPLSGELSKDSPTAFDKIKLGFKNCVTKVKRDSFKTNAAKPVVKKRVIKKGIFQSKENICADLAQSCTSSKSLMNDHLNKMSLSPSYPGYLSFEKDL